jgi:hypothetical protein
VTNKKVFEDWNLIVALCSGLHCGKHDGQFVQGITVPVEKIETPNLRWNCENFSRLLQWSYLIEIQSFVSLAVSGKRLGIQRHQSSVYN